MNTAVTTRAHLSVVSFLLVSEEQVMSVHWGDSVPGPPKQRDLAAVDTWGHSTKLSLASGLVKGVTEFTVKFLPGKESHFWFLLQGGTSQRKPAVSGRVCQGLKRTQPLAEGFSASALSVLGARQVFAAELSCALQDVWQQPWPLPYPLDATTTP